MARILLADDDEIIADVVRRAFGVTDHFVGWLADGSRALEVVRQRQPHLLLLDCNMPGMSGINVLRELRKSEDTYDLPILMLTGRQSDEDERISLFEGANGYIRKPFQPEALVRHAERLLEGARPRAGL